jgi:tetraacyldisaccharide 4'-kinase
MKSLLNLLLSHFWSFSSLLVQLGLRLRLLKSARLDAFVVSVGNLQVGGAGKTPLVAFLAQEAIARGKKVAILSRGYGGAWERAGGVIAPGDRVDVQLSGDEAALIHWRVPEAWLGVGADRVRQWKEILARGFQPDWVILDDGFQHWRIQKDLELVALTSLRRSEVLFRDWNWALRRAHLLIWTKGERMPWMPEGKPWSRIRYRIPAPHPGQARILLVTGVADGRQVQASLVDAGYSIAHHYRFPDHAEYPVAEVRSILNQAQKDLVSVAVTGKDWVKWKALGLSAEELERVLVIEPELDWLEGRSSWNRVLWGE